MDKQWHLYKIEVDGHLIYIGVTNDIGNRREQHVTKRLIPMLGGNMTVIESYRERPVALAAEVAAIRKHRPVGNFQSNPVGYKTKRDRDLALFRKLSELEAARWRRLYDDIEAEMK